MALPFLAAIRLPSSRGRSLSLSDRQSILEFLRNETLALRRAPGEVDWPVIDNPGIEWGGAILRQGDPWEDALEIVADLGARTPRTFRTFDFWNIDGRIATSTKTLNTQGLSYLDRPSRVYGQLKRYLDQVDRFEQDSKKGLSFSSNEILQRRLDLAVPESTTPEQIFQIQRAIDYAESLGIEMTVRFIR